MSDIMKELYDRERKLPPIKSMGEMIEVLTLAIGLPELRDVGAKKKSKKQVGLLLSKNSPLTPAQKAKLKGELSSGAVKVKKNSKRKKK